MDTDYAEQARNMSVRGKDADAKKGTAGRPEPPLRMNLNIK
jgi:hypothetical protein